ncbi:hypothetical protein E1B28_002577 [Marasmius oreades]|uniref:RING-type domain-containing protein n=1 Tax=Marasmius oreades TaxID=181124 RepID=A0A9P7RNX7_9AGAR|nr:uncharacterized protein E1B28_002577 [Marasmius oreades]KAG7086635.1 hypothetical protein E1B28_002577 [Marasmius oreades]
MPSMKSTLSSSSCQFEALYCSLCDKYFYSKNMLRQHLESSSRHPRCEPCKKSFLNMNSLRNHYVLSSRHNYCRECDRSFKTSSGFRVHMEHAPCHREDFDDDDAAEYDDSNYPKDWEDEMAARLDRQAHKEDPIITENDSSPPMSRVEVGKAILALKKRIAKQSKKVTQSCPICLSVPKSMSAAQCGHLFCTSCITHAFENNHGCPSCRRPGKVAQLRKVDLYIS